jgi:hypothetical protein
MSKAKKKNVQKQYTKILIYLCANLRVRRPIIIIIIIIIIGFGFEDEGGVRPCLQSQGHLFMHK